MSTKDYSSLDATPRKLKTISEECGRYLTLWDDGTVVSSKKGRPGINFGSSFFLEKNDAREVFMKNGIPYPDVTQSSHQSRYERHRDEYSRLSESYHTSDDVPPEEITFSDEPIANVKILTADDMRAMFNLTPEEEGEFNTSKVRLKSGRSKMTIQEWSELDEKRTLG